MKRRWLTWLWVLWLCGCALEPPPMPQPTPEPTTAVVEASPRPTTTPIAATPTAATPTASPTATSTPTTTLATPSLAPTTLVPTSAAPPPSPVLPPAALSFCRRPFGAARAARWSARLDAIRVEETEEQIEVTLSFTDLDGALHGIGACFWAASWPQDGDLGTLDAPGRAYVGLDLDNWAHDDKFAASIITETVEVTADTTLSPERASPPPSDEGEALQFAFAARSRDSRGAQIGIGLPEPRPFAVRVEGSNVIVEIAQADAAPFPPTDDPLGEEQGESPSPSDLFWLQDGAIYRYEDGAAEPISTALHAITDLAVDPAMNRLTVCARGENDDEQTSALWLIADDGSDPRLLTPAGGCSNPVFDPNGQTIAFGASVDGSEQGLPQVWTVPTDGGEARLIGSALDPWSRSSPRWLDGERLVYRATSDDGTSLLLINEDGVERELSARLLTGTLYRGIGAFVVDPASDLIAVEALRMADDGSDLAVLRSDGNILATEQRGFAQQPLGFTDRGLVYLTVECASPTVQRYALRIRTERGIETLLTGSTAATIDAALPHGETLLYVRRTPEEQLLQPNTGTSPSRSEVWLLSGNGDSRTRLSQADGTISVLTGAIH